MLIGRVLTQADACELTRKVQRVEHLDGELLSVGEVRVHGVVHGLGAAHLRVCD